MAKTSLKNASYLSTKDKTNRKNASYLSTKDKTNRKNASYLSTKDKISRIYENLNAGFGKTGSERQNRTVCLKGFLYNRIAILFFTHYLTKKSFRYGKIIPIFFVKLQAISAYCFLHLLSEAERRTLKI
ncbi:MAG: hypothetical protein LBL33_02985 [Tannerella sp.]|jgi:hypothetical protein|nr:hypothetical protein [Tannerella sp.]